LGFIGLALRQKRSVKLDDEQMEVKANGETGDAQTLRPFPPGRGDRRLPALSKLVGVSGAFGGHRFRLLRASKVSAALLSKTSARCLAFSSGHTSTEVSVPFGSIRATCHPLRLWLHIALVSYCKYAPRAAGFPARKNKLVGRLLRFVLSNSCSCRFGFVQDGLSDRYVLNAFP
jgi:hypothetical protein